MLSRRCLWALPAFLVACAQPAPVAPGRYLVGEPYQLGGVWSYPREDFALAESGLASVAGDSRAGRVTANGEVHDPGLLMAAHRTLQLPAILEVTNLESGLTLAVRVNDRGPSQPGRVVELSRRAATLLGMPANGAAQVRIRVIADASRALAAGFASSTAPRLDITAPPVGAVTREELAPPPGATQAGRVREARPLPGGRAAIVEVGAGNAPPPARLPEQVTRGWPQPGRLFIEGATFSRRDMADRQAARLRPIGGRVEQTGFGGRGASPTFRVRAGPFGSVAEADRALEQARLSGVSDGRIVID
jgi:rare lipoprotein A